MEHSSHVSIIRSVHLKTKSKYSAHINIQQIVVSKLIFITSLLLSIYTAKVKNFFFLSEIPNEKKMGNPDGFSIGYAIVTYVYNSADMCSCLDILFRVF